MNKIELNGKVYNVDNIVKKCLEIEEIKTSDSKRLKKYYFFVKGYNEPFLSYFESDNEEELILAREKLISRLGEL